jgi:hypothetical protein
MSKSATKNELNAMIPTANTVASGCHPVETAGENTVTMPVKNGHIELENGTVKRPSVPFTNTKRATMDKRPCQQCGCEMVVKRPSKQYCNAACRRKAWLQRNPEKAAALAASDKERLRVHLESKGIAWVERGAA